MTKSLFNISKERKMLKKYGVLLGLLVMLGGCASTTPTITKVHEIDYPEGMSVLISDGILNDKVSITNARIVDGKYKKQAQLVVSNTSNKALHVKIAHEWNDKRGVVIAHSFNPPQVRLAAHASQRVLLDAPNFKAKDVLINVSCASGCVEK